MPLLELPEPDCPGVHFAEHSTIQVLDIQREAYLQALEDAAKIAKMYGMTECPKDILALAKEMP